MKIGMIFECGPAGADKKVCGYLADRFATENGLEIEIEPVTLDNKPNLISECGRTAGDLLKQGCDKVVVVWDLFPPWREKGERPCRKEDREAISRSLADAGVPSENVCLVCITEELEAWLLADGRALSEILSTKTRKVTIQDEKKPERVRNPKKALSKVFQEKTGRPYTDRIHAEKIMRALPDLRRLEKYSPSFKRFLSKIEP